MAHLISKPAHFLAMQIARFGGCGPHDAKKLLQFGAVSNYCILPLAAAGTIATDDAGSSLPFLVICVSQRERNLVRAFNEWCYSG